MNTLQLLCRCLTGLACFGLLHGNISATTSSAVMLMRTPNNGIQPQAALDSKGVLHLIYYSGEPKRGDLFYVRREPGQEKFSAPFQVNSQRGSAHATGIIRGAQLAIGQDDSVHVAWTGLEMGRGMMAKKGWMNYTRLLPGQKSFAPQREVGLMQNPIDGGAIAADRAGNVYLTWHAGEMGQGESSRRVYLARSTDSGQSFEAARAINPPNTGACGCCGMRVTTDAKGTLFVTYRAAANNVNRDSMVLVSHDHGATFAAASAQPWKIFQCPMSGWSLAESPAGMFMSWETEKQVFFGKVDSASGKISDPKPAPGATNDRKHPLLVAQADGSLLFAWTEGITFTKGGALAWQVFDKNGQPTSEKGRVDGGVPRSSVLSGFADARGGFTLIY